ncbi:hypothetical protein [Micromonospora viridifaciens]|uniref:hypothetical protein n=1 Tax=Micromonospora viridifaciens TaxID=1881 RepID=UPI000B5AC3BF|nr:hypothetical protein [Micromonospora viridifaciens]
MPGTVAVWLVADQLADPPVREGDHVRVGAGPVDQAAQLGGGVDDALDHAHPLGEFSARSQRIVMYQRVRHSTLAGKPNICSSRRATVRRGGAVPAMVSALAGGDRSA